MRFGHSIRRNALILPLLAAMCQAEVIPVVDPPEELTRVLQDWNTPEGSDEAVWRPYGEAEPVDAPDGRTILRGNGHLLVYNAPEPNRFPFIRIKASGASGPGSRLIFSASPHTGANKRTLRLPERGHDGESTVRLPPDQILTTQAYFGGSLRMAVEQGQDGLMIDYIMADAVPTRALAEFDIPYSNPARVDGIDPASATVSDGLLRMPWRQGAALAFDLPHPAERDWDALELRVRASTGGDIRRALNITWTSGAVRGTHRLELEPGDGFHTYRLHMHKEPSWRPPGTFRFALHGGEEASGHFIEIDFVRLRDFPDPGGGSTAGSSLELDANRSDWTETARLLDHWRVLTSARGDEELTGFWSGTGRSFSENQIRWQTAQPAGTWLNGGVQMPRLGDGTPDIQASARLAYEDLNATAKFLERRSAQLDTVYFPGLFEALLRGGLMDSVSGHKPTAYRLAAETFCAFMVLARNETDSALYAVRFVVEPDFLAWGWQHGGIDYAGAPNGPGNFHAMMEILEEADRAHLDRGAYITPSPLAGYAADLALMPGDPRRLVSFEWSAQEAFGRSFTAGSTIHSEPSPETLERLRRFRGAGGRISAFTPSPDRPIGHTVAGPEGGPSPVLPETGANTLTWTLLQAARLCLFMEQGPASE